MKRLTIKGIGNYGLITTDLQKVYDKLGEIEDMEEKLGLDLLTIIKATGSFKFRNADGSMTYTCGNYGFGAWCRKKCIMSNKREFPLDQYRITWCLLEEDDTNLISQEEYKEREEQ